MSNEASLTRRGFVAGAAATGAAMAMVQAQQALAEPATGIPETWDYETDILVIGYGGAGLWCALTAKDEGESDVLILEKAPFRGGGNSSYNMGSFCLPQDHDKAVQYIVNSTHGQVDEPLASTWVDEAMRNGEYCDKWGVAWYTEDDFTYLGKLCEYEMLPGADGMGVGNVEGLGMQCFETLDAAREQLGIQVVFSCHDEVLIQDPETKEILGCTTLIGDDEMPKTVKARKATVVCTGGYEFNEEMKDHFLKCKPAKFYGWKFNTGDGIPMVARVGAQLWHMDLYSGGAVFAPANKDPEFPWGISGVSCKGSYIHVNQQGERWHNENGPMNPHNGWHAYLEFNEGICDFDHIPTWVVFDQVGFDAGRMGPQPGDNLARGNYAPGFPEELGGWGDAWSDDNMAELEKGWILKADTIEELAEQINDLNDWGNWMDAETLKATLERYNQMVEAGVDEDFGRPEKRLVGTIANPPYYAFPIYPGGCSTYGGAKRNASAQVLDWDDNPIPRLYSAGSFGNFLGHSYGITGGNVAENMVFGRIAARHASSLDAWDANA